MYTTEYCMWRATYGRISFLVSKVTVDDIFVRLQGVGLLKLQCGLCWLYSSKCLLRVWALRIYSSYSAGTVLCTHSECRVGTLTVCAVDNE